jgi:hypothetical protein
VEQQYAKSLERGGGGELEQQQQRRVAGHEQVVKWVDEAYRAIRSRKVRNQVIKSDAVANTLIFFFRLRFARALQTQTFYGPANQEEPLDKTYYICDIEFFKHIFLVQSNFKRHLFLSMK